jgi:thymidine kinase
MAKLYYKYGAMGSSKSAQVLITKFNYVERDMTVWLIKPSADVRDGSNIVRSRIGLTDVAECITPDVDLWRRYQDFLPKGVHVIIADECQFFAADQIDQLRRIVDECAVPVLCFGLRTDFLTHLFPGSRRLFELADSISEIKTICSCGFKATVNARIDPSGKIITQGEQVLLGGNDQYIAMCHQCWKKKIKEQEALISKTGSGR